MEVVKHETCLEYFRRRLREGWKCLRLEGYNAVLQSPEGLIRPVDLRNDVETLRPNAVGDETSIPRQFPDSTFHWDKVDEVEADDLTTYLYCKDENVYRRDLYNIPDSGVGAGTINFVKIYFRCRRAASGDGFAKPALKSNTTVTDGNEVELIGSFVTYSQQWNTNPAPPGTDAWTWADIDALQIGVSLKVTATAHNSICTQVYVEVDYTPGATEKSSSDTGSGVDAYVSLETAEAKSSSDTGSGVEGTPVPAATLADSESGQGQGAISSQLAAIIAVEVGTSVELGSLLKDLIASELGQGSDSFVAKIEVPTKGGGMKLWI